MKPQRETNPLHCFKVAGKSSEQGTDVILFCLFWFALHVTLCNDIIGHITRWREKQKLVWNQLENILYIPAFWIISCKPSGSTHRANVPQQSKLLEKCGERSWSGLNPLWFIHMLSMTPVLPFVFLLLQFPFCSSFLSFPVSHALTLFFCLLLCPSPSSPSLHSSLRHMLVHKWGIYLMHITSYFSEKGKLRVRL